MSKHIVAAHVVPLEATPLLTPGLERNDPFEARTKQPSKRPSSQTATTIINLVYLAVTLFSFGDKLSEGPLLRIKEAVICYQYYERADPTKLLLGRDQVGPGAIGGVFESLCKADDVQNDLAALNGWQTVFDGIPGLLLAIPVGWAADKYGRWPVVELGIISLAAKIAWMEIVTWFWQTLDIRLTWLSTLPAFFTGGNMVVVAMLFVTLTDVTPEAERATVFIRVTAFNLSAALLMPPLASWLMKYSPWIPSLCGLALMVSAVVVYAFVPETLGFTPSTEVVTPPQDSNKPATDTPTEQSWRTTVRRCLLRVKEATTFLTSDWRILVLMVPFIGYTISIFNVFLLLQYMSKRYTLSLAESNLLYTIYSGAIVVVFFVLIPLASNILTQKTKISGQRKDLYLGRASAVFMAFGWALIGLAPNIPAVTIGLMIAALGHGGASILRSFLSSLVPAHHIGRLFSVVGFVDNLGMMAGAPTLARLYKEGLRLGGAWKGLPFVCVGIIMLACSVLLFLIKIHPDEERHWNTVQREDNDGDDS